MDYRKEFERMMQTQTAIALATAIDGMPNVRIVNFYYDSAGKILYFSSFADNEKIEELVQNPHVAFTTITTKDEEHVRVKNAMVGKSTMPVEKIKDKFLAKLPEYIMSIPAVLPELMLFEITFDRADVVLDFEHIGNIIL